jgi:ubiquinone biosynthesis protein UbiJ
MLASMQTILNRLLQADPQLSEKLGPLEGKAIQIVLVDFTLVITLRIANSQILLLSANENIGIDLTLRGTPAALIQMAKHPDYSLQGITITGDAMLAKQLSLIARSVDFDWQGLLADAIGDVPAYHVSKFASKLQQFCAQSISSFSLNLTDYLQQETLTTPHPLEIEPFTQEVVELRDAVERLSARIQSLSPKRKLPA